MLVRRDSRAASKSGRRYRCAALFAILLPAAGYYEPCVPESMAVPTLANVSSNYMPHSFTSGDGNPEGLPMADLTLSLEGRYIDPDA